MYKSYLEIIGSNSLTFERYIDRYHQDTFNFYHKVPSKVGSPDQSFLVIISGKDYSGRWHWDLRNGYTYVLSSFWPIIVTIKKYSGFYNGKPTYVEHHTYTEKNNIQSVSFSIGVGNTNERNLRVGYIR